MEEEGNKCVCIRICAVVKYANLSVAWFSGAKLLQRSRAIACANARAIEISDATLPLCEFIVLDRCLDLRIQVPTTPARDTPR